MLFTLDEDKQMINRVGTGLEHDDMVTSVDVSSDNSIAVSASQDAK